MFLNLHDKDINTVSVRKAVQSRKQTVVEKSLPLKLAEKKIERTSETTKKPQSGASTTITTQLQYKDRPRQLHNFDWNTSEVNSSNTATPSQFPTTSAEIISKIYLAKFKEKESIQSRKPSRAFENQKRREKTPIDVTQKWDNVFAPNQALSLNDVRKLFITCGLDYDDVIPLNVRQKIIRETQGGKGGKKIELKVLKEMVSEFLLAKGRGRKTLSMKKIRQPQIDLSLPEGTRIATVGMAEASEASEIHSIIEKKGFFHRDMNKIDHEQASEHSLTKKKSQKILRAEDLKLMQQRSRAVNSRFDFTDIEKRRFIDRIDIIKDFDYPNVQMKMTGSREGSSTNMTAQQQQLHFQILKCRDTQYEYDFIDRDGKILNPIAERPPRSRAAQKLPRQPECKILIRIYEERWHQNHPVNQAIRVINQFSIEAFLKQGMSSFFHKKKDSLAKNQPPNRQKGLCMAQTQASAQAQILAQNNLQPPLVMSPVAANPMNPGAMDMKVICSLAETLTIAIPRNHDLRSKAFICHAKEQMLRKLYDSLNQSNGIELNFKRQNFSHYKGFVGRGNNAQLIFQLFKGTRWWWNLFSEAILDENGKPIILQGQTSQLLREDFKEHNFIFTQWKRQYHFQVLKQLKVTTPDSEQPTDQEPPGRTVKQGKEPKSTIFNQESKGTNISNEWRIYAKMEANYHLSNKYALFYNMTKYYRSIGQDPWDVLPLTFHIKKGTKDQIFFDFLKVFKQFEEQTEAFKILQKQMTEQEQKMPSTDYKIEEIVLPLQPNEMRNLLPTTYSQQSQVNLMVSDAGFKQNKIADLRNMLCNRCKKTDSFIAIKQNQSNEILGRPQELKEQSLGRQMHLQTTMTFKNPDFLESQESAIIKQRKQSNITSTHESSFGTKINKTTPRKKTPTPSKIDFSRQSNSQHPSQTNNYNSNAEKKDSDSQSGVKSSITCACCGDVYFDWQQIKGPEMPKIMNRIDPGSENRITKDDQSLLITTNTAFVPYSVETEQSQTTRRTLTQIDRSLNNPNMHPYSSHNLQSVAPSQIATKLPVIVGADNESYKDLQGTTIILRETALSFRQHNHANNMSRDRSAAKSFLKSPISRKKTFPLNAQIKGKAIVRQESQEPKKPNQTENEHSRQRSPLTKTGFKEESKTRSFSPDKNIWIVKPGENTNRGNGIDVCQCLKEIKKIVSQSECDPSRTFILQKYIERPALYMQRKFDIRCFGMLTLINQKLKGFTYDDGYLRTSSRIFKRGQLANKLIHLTNDAVQKKADDYGKFETGNKLTFGEYQAYLSKFHPDLKIDFRAHIFSQIKQIMTDTFRATFKIIAPTRDMQHHTFEIFGFDFMLDEDFKVYLIEVNTNPCLETTCPILSKIINDMVDSAFKVAIDPLYPPPNHQKRMNTQVSVIQWHLSFDEDLDSDRIQQIQTRKNSREHAPNGRQAEDDTKEMEEKLISEMEAAPEIFD